jgi:hypothetical protein
VSLDLKYEDLKYDPSISRAVLRPNGSDWYVFLEHADGTPVHRMVFTYDEVGNAIAEDQVADAETVITYIGDCLTAAGYSAVLEADPLPRPFIGAWALGPKK